MWVSGRVCFSFCLFQNVWTSKYCFVHTTLGGFQLENEMEFISPKVYFRFGHKGKLHCESWSYLIVKDFAVCWMIYRVVKGGGSKVRGFPNLPQTESLGFPRNTPSPFSHPGTRKRTLQMMLTKSLELYANLGYTKHMFAIVCADTTHFVWRK